MVPHADTREDVPYYHPVLRKIAFRYRAVPPNVVTPATDAVTEFPPQLDELPEVRGTISISILPFSDELAPTPSTVPDAQLVSSDVLPNRTYRTCLHLLETLHKHGWGRLTGYQKRVIHDVRLNHWSYAYIHLALFGVFRYLLSHGSDTRFKQVIIEKTSFQDLYLIMKERHKHLDSRVKKIRSNILEDLKRHVWKVCRFYAYCFSDCRLKV